MKYWRTGVSDCTLVFMGAASVPQSPDASLAPSARPPRRALAQAHDTVQTLVEQGRPEEAVEFLLAALAAVLDKSAELELLIAKLRRANHRSEHTDPGQLALLLEQLAALGSVDDAAPVDPEAEAREDEALDQEIAAAERAHPEDAPTAPSRRRWQTSAAVERRVKVHELPRAERACPTCGRERQSLGVDVTHALEYVPGHFVDHEHHRTKYACGTCKEGIATAAAPAKVLPRSAADASLLAHIVVSKYVDHCPLHRLHRIYARSGATIPVSTLADWVGEVGALVLPLVEVLAARVRHATVVRTDATGLRVLDPTSPANIEWGTMWCYVGDDRDVVFRYTPRGDGATGPWKFLAGRTGYTHADAASVFDRLYDGQAASAIEVGCWAHGRRRLVALQDMDCRVAYPLTLIARLYRIERLADAQHLDMPGRTALRQERAPPLLAKLQRWLVATGEKEPPSSDLAKAAAYLVNQWTALTRFVDDARLSLDNNLCEQQLRDIALGRKNFLFAGSHDAASRAAALYSLLRTCALHGVLPLPYLTDVLRKLSTGEYDTRLDELLPDRWQTAQTTVSDERIAPAAG